MNIYEVTATNATGGNIARGCAASSRSNQPGNDPGKAVNGVIGETGYYESAGTSAAEFWQVDLASGYCAFAANAGAPQACSSASFTRARA